MDLAELLRQSDPARLTPPPDGQSPIARWTYAQITRPKSRPILRRPRLRLRPVLALVMTLALVVTLGDLLRGRTTHPTASPAVQELHHLATVVLSQPTNQPGPGQYLYTETKSLYQTTIYQENIASDRFVPVATAQYQETEQSWADAKGVGSTLLTRSALQFPTASDQMAWDANQFGQQYSSTFQRSEVESGSSQDVPDVASLSTDPHELATELATGKAGSNVDQGPNGRAAVFQRVARLLVGPVSGMTPTLASALYQVLADQPDVTFLGPVTDHSGRQGIGLSVLTADGASQLVVNPNTGLALELQYPPPASSMFPSSPGSATKCPHSTTCSTGGQPLPPEGTEAFEGPLWTDTAVSAVVDAEGATPPTTALSDSTLLRPGKEVFPLPI
jgi:hypothetical protein